ncbi:aldehyde ferredoxin oxidoreductase C-terminal domain-containing protein [Desulforhopalus singaporensis]|uniref:Aldehyde:ferredoxin oxidoreductase n=1 Tax=Desulforhopalus singaporensis TaxID=91360 RepID=A0A1H0VG58_9BACT|nr:aldehyde ferredoxin oxidoreductase C-terminal domain-containing protein [Desulforhopalus singaporensis]SDP77341.1 aldehyde:ferredoxin oxidoreductase [Desulforhopalus singaporensis]
MWKSVRVNTRTCSVAREDIKDDYKLLGGRSLIAQFVMDEVDPRCDPLGRDNKMVFCTGIFAGTSVSTAHRLSVGAKSPLTGTIKESNAGGTGATYLANHGIRMLVLEDMPETDDWKIVRIDANSEVSLIPAGDYLGLDNYAVVDKAKAEYGDNVSVISIGKSGEMQYKNAGIAVTEFGKGHPCRLAARGGLGGLMGTKQVKAIIMEQAAQKYKPEIADPDAFKEKVLLVNKAMAEGANTSPLAQIGTNSITAASGPQGVLPVKNFNGELSKNYEALSPTTFMENLASRGGKNRVGCQAGCLVKCSNIYHGKDGKYLTASLEYETIALCGANLDINDLDRVAEIDRFCDEFGVDTIEVGATLGVIMDTGKIAWGDADAAMDLLKEMEEGTEFGRLMGEGTEAVGNYLGAKRIPTVKKQAIAGYDPRNCKSLGITYAMSTQGADHTFSSSFGAAPSIIDNSNKFFQPYIAQLLANLTAFVDSSICLIAVGALGLPGIELLPGVLAAMHGIEFTMEDLAAYSAKVILTERAYNKAAGFTVEDDKLPQFFSDEVSKATGAVFDLTEEEMQAILKFV